MPRFSIFSSHLKTCIACLSAAALSTSPLSLAQAAAHLGRKTPVAAKSEKKKKSGKKKAKPAAAKTDPEGEPSANRPAAFIAARAQKVLTKLKSRPLPMRDHRESVNEIAASANKGSWLAAIYEKNLVEASWATEMLSDKRIFAEVLERELGDQARAFYPKTLGLREFLVKHRLVNAKGALTATGEQIEEGLFEEFPAGFVVRPAVGVAPQERGQGLYPDSDQFVVELLKPGSPLYSPAHMRQAVRSHILDAVASGEAIVLQEDVMRVADAKKPLKHRFFNEVRIHTFENRVVEGAVPERWVQTNLLNAEEIRAAEVKVAELLKSLPLDFLSRQAWGVDVAVMDNGEMRIIDIVTNRGKDLPWSGYLDQPRVIGAYTRHLETYYGLRFEGISGSLIRNNFANYLPFWQRRIEKAKPGWSKMTAYLPPVP